MEYVIEPQPIITVPVSLESEVNDQSPQFPLHRIYCIGRNYGEHVKEMGGDPKKEPPVFFSKPVTSCVVGNRDVNYPQATKNLHHEVELVVALKAGGKNIAVESAMACVYGYAVGVDFTRRDLQTQAKAKGMPWDTAKGFDQSAPVSSIVPAAAWNALDDAEISLRVNDELRQKGNINEMIWSVPEIICELSKLFELKSGDLIYTGTPSGVGAVVAGDHLSASIEGLGSLEFNVVNLT